MGMILVEVIRANDRGRDRMKRGFAIDEKYAEDYTMRAKYSWNTKHILFIRPCMVDMDLPGAKSVIVTLLGEFHTPQSQHELAARIHEIEERGIDFAVCTECGESVDIMEGASSYDPFLRFSRRLDRKTCEACEKAKAAS